MDSDGLPSVGLSIRIEEFFKRVPGLSVVVLPLVDL